MEIGGQVPILVTAVVPRGWFLDCFQRFVLPLLEGPFSSSFKLWTWGISSSRSANTLVRPIVRCCSNSTL